MCTSARRYVRVSPHHAKRGEQLCVLAREIRYHADCSERRQRAAQGVSAGNDRIVGIVYKLISDGGYYAKGYRVPTHTPLRSVGGRD